MNSKIINMGDYRMDDDDRRLQALFAHSPLDDNGFSERVIHKLESKTRLRRLLLAIAILAGGLIAARPAMQLAGRLVTEMQGVATGVAEVSEMISFLPAALAVSAALAGVAALRWLER